MRATADTNVLVYASGENDLTRQRIAVELMQALYVSRTVLAAQALAELHRVLTRKFKRPADEVERQLAEWREYFTIVPTTSDCLAEAATLVTLHHFQIFDAIIIAAAAQSGCRVLFSEDMRHGAVFNGVTIVNPFADERHPMLLAVLQPKS